MSRFNKCSPEKQEKGAAYIRTLPAEKLAPVIARLLELADGAAPITVLNGICYDVQSTLCARGHALNAYDVLGDAFLAQGYDDTGPIKGNGWRGMSGDDRRELCRRTANYLEEVLEKRNASV